MGGFLYAAYGAVVYVYFIATFVYAIGFIGGVFVPKTIDSGEAGSVAAALAVNLALLGVFAVQHSVMARKGFKRWWTRIVPPALERSTYVLAATLALAALLAWWRPIAEPVIWRAESPALVSLLWVVFVLGWGLVFLSTFLIDHFELFGLRQALAPLARAGAGEPRFRTPFLYRYVRHPLYLGFIIGSWATPFMTAGHLLFAAGATGYILVGVWFEERDLVAQFGDQYRRYREQVGMLIPGRKGP